MPFGGVDFRSRQVAPSIEQILSSIQCFRLVSREASPQENPRNARDIYLGSSPGHSVGVGSYSRSALTFTKCTEPYVSK